MHFYRQWEQRKQVFTDFNLVFPEDACIFCTSQNCMGMFVLHERLKSNNYINWMSVGVQYLFVTVYKCSELESKSGLIKFRLHWRQTRHICSPGRAYMYTHFTIILKIWTKSSISTVPGCHLKTRQRWSLGKKVLKGVYKVIVMQFFKFNSSSTMQATSFIFHRSPFCSLQRSLLSSSPLLDWKVIPLHLLSFCTYRYAFCRSLTILQLLVICASWKV